MQFLSFPISLLVAPKKIEQSLLTKLVESCVSIFLLLYLHDDPEIHYIHAQKWGTATFDG